MQIKLILDKIKIFNLQRMFVLFLEFQCIYMPISACMLFLISIMCICMLN
jgi:hypothetical protein